MTSSEKIINQTKKWITDVVIGCNFCPFAAVVIKQQKIHYQVETSKDMNTCLSVFLQELKRLDQDPGIETSFLIFPDSFQLFQDYLNLLYLTENVLKKEGYEGVYQLASFHPLYLFAGTTENDASNYTNRSVYPMLHLLREESIDQALKKYGQPENIPERNIQFAKRKGLVYMKMLRDACL
jgi:hypothetical protein